MAINALALSIDSTLTVSAKASSTPKGHICMLAIMASQYCSNDRHLTVPHLAAFHLAVFHLKFRS